MYKRLNYLGSAGVIKINHSGLESWEGVMAGFG